MSWADEARTLGVRANADQPDQAAAAIAFGAEGIGLCRTEHMFFGEGKIEPMREMILADTIEARARGAGQAAAAAARRLRGHLPRHGRPAGDHPHLDPPLHEFLPHDASRPAGAGRADSACRSSACARASRRCTSSTRCSASAAAGSASSTPRSPRCRRAPSSRPPATVRRDGIAVHPEVMIPLVGAREGARAAGRDRARASPREVMRPSRRASSRTWSAR